MQKKIVVVTVIVLLTLWIGTSPSGNFFRGDINMIDEGQFGAWANHMLHGKLMYKDMYIVYGPLYVYPLFILFKIFFPSAFLVRLYLLLGGTLGIIASDFLLLELKIKKNIRLGVLTVFILVPVLHLREAAALWTLYVLVKANGKDSRQWYLIAGVLGALTFLISPDFGIFILLVIFLHAIFQYFKRGWKQVSKKMMPFLSGYCLFLGICFVWFYHEGWFFDYLRVTLDVSTSLAGINVPNGQNFPNPLSLVQSTTVLGTLKSLLSKDFLLYQNLLVLFSSFFYLTFKEFKSELEGTAYNIFLITLFGLMVFAVLLTRNGVGHYYYSLPPVLLLVAYFIDRLWVQRKESPRLNGLLITLLSLFLIRIIYVNNPALISMLSPSTYVESNFRVPNRVGFLNISPDQANKIKSIQQFIGSNTSPNDTVFFFNDEPMMYLLVDRVNPTNYDLPFAGNTIEKRYQMRNELINNRPKFIIIDKDVWAVDGIANTQRLPEVYTYIISNYHIYKQLDNVLIYSLNSLVPK